MVTTSGFSHTPVSRFLILLTTSSTILTSILDAKHLLPIKFTPHLWPYLQLTRLFTFQCAYTTSTELLFSIVLLYHFRVLERLWGSRKYASFVAVVFFLNLWIVPMLGLVMKMLTLGSYNYIPAGATGVVFACLSAWGDEVPRLYRYKILTDPAPPRAGSSSEHQQQSQQDGSAEGGGGGGAAGAGQDSPGLVFSDKSTTYLLAAQLALSQFPFQLLPAAVGWMLGGAWTGEMLPGGLGRWRIPAWVVGESAKRKERDQFEGLRRRLEEEGSAADGMRNVSDQAHAAGFGSEAESRRGGAGGGFGRQILGYFTGS